MSVIPTSGSKASASSHEWQLIRTVNGNIQFGSNIHSTVPLIVVTPGAPNTEFTINHNLGFLPNGFLVLSKDKTCDVYNGATTWTTSQIFLKCTVATVSLTIVVL